MPRYKPSDVALTIELTDVYDGVSVIVLRDGTRLNRWADDDPTKPIPGYERRYQAAQEWMNARAEQDLMKDMP